MSRMTKMMVLLSMTNVWAGSPSYLVPGQMKNDKCQGVCKAQMSGLQDKVDFTLASEKAGSTKVKMVHLNGKSFDIEMQDEFSLQEGVPFFEVVFPRKDGVTTKIYGLRASQGTAGASFHYFIKDKSQYKYSGMHPEIIFDNELSQFVSVEKDGPRIHQTTWVISEGVFKPTSQEVVK